MKNELYSNNLTPIPFPKAKRTISLIIAYLGIVVVIALFFSPILGIIETEEIGGETFIIKAACSPYQFLTKDTYAEIHVFGGTDTENDFLELLGGKIDVADGATDGVLPFNLYEKGDTFSSVLATVLLIIIYVPLTVTLVLAFSGKLTAKPKRLNNETDEAYKTRLLRLAGNEELIRFAHLRAPQILISIVGFPIMATILFCAFSFAFNLDHLGNGDIFPPYRSNVDILLLICAIILLIVAFGLTGGIGLGKINKLLRNNYVCDYVNQVIRPRTPEETEKFFAMHGIKTNEPTTPFYKSQNISQNNTNSITTQTGQTMTEESRIKLLKEYKALLDGGVISTAEYEAKKQELLGSYNKDK